MAFENVASAKIQRYAIGSPQSPITHKNLFELIIVAPIFSYFSLCLYLFAYPSQLITGMTENIRLGS